MPEYIRALIVIFTLTLITYGLMNVALDNKLNIKKFKQWQLIWLGVLISALIIKNFWLMAAILFLIFNASLNPRSINRVFLFLILVCTLPSFNYEIPGFAGIRYIFELNYTRLMILCLLLPLILSIRNKQKLFSIPTDRYLISFLLLLSALQFRDNTITNSLRESLELFIDIFIPYYAITRGITKYEHLQTAMIALFIGIIPFALLGIFEVMRGWLIYTPIIRELSELKFNLYTDIRGGGVRASLLMGPIVLGYVMIFAGAILFYLQYFIKNRLLVFLAFSAIFLCLLATKSRGPWIGFAMMVVIFLWTGRAGFSRTVKYGIFSILLILPLTLTPTGNKYVQLLPFIGEERADTFDYRSRLIDQAIILFKKNPLFGDVNFRETPEMEAMRQGQGIIDVVNSYIGIVLPYGLIALSLFIGIFIVLIYHCRKIVKYPKTENEVRLMGRSLIACIFGVMLTIGTVSSISFIPHFYWILIAITSAYININNIKKIAENKYGSKET